MYVAARYPGLLRRGSVGWCGRTFVGACGFAGQRKLLECMAARCIQKNTYTQNIGEEGTVRQVS